MASTYNHMISEELNLIRELNNLDGMLVKGDDQKNLFPHLFQDEESSLFQPDQCYEHQKVEEHQIFQQPKYEQKKPKKYEKRKTKDVEMFQQYLDSLEINQFIQKQCSKSFREKQKDKNSLQCTFKPTILKKSNSIAENLKPSFDRLTNSISTKKIKTPYKQIEKSQNKKLYSKDRIQKLSKPRPLKTEPAQEKVEYTFKPNLDKRSLEQMSSCYLDVATRNKLWLEQKQAKVQKLRTEEEERKVVLQENFHAPKINNYKGQKGANLSKFVKQGMANYFERVSMAKQRNSYIPQKQNEHSGRDSIISGYSSKKIEKSPIKQNTRKSMNGNSSHIKMKMKENTDSGNQTGKKSTKNLENTKGKRRYKDAVQQLHEKIMKLKI